MLDKHLRILIIDPINVQAYLIEKMLNVMGYYCIATTTTINEGLLLSRYGMRNFDVLIAPMPLLILNHCQVNLFKGFNIKNLFLYKCTSHQQEVPIMVNGKANFEIGLPEYASLYEFMAQLTTTRPTGVLNVGESHR